MIELAYYERSFERSQFHDGQDLQLYFIQQEFPRGLLALYMQKGAEKDRPRQYCSLHPHQEAVGYYTLQGYFVPKSAYACQRCAMHFRPGKVTLFQTRDPDFLWGDYLKPTGAEMRVLARILRGLEQIALPGLPPPTAPQERQFFGQTG